LGPAQLISKKIIGRPPAFLSARGDRVRASGVPVPGRSGTPAAAVPANEW